MSKSSVTDCLKFKLENLSYLPRIKTKIIKKTFGNYLYSLAKPRVFSRLRNAIKVSKQSKTLAESFFNIQNENSTIQPGVYLFPGKGAFAGDNVVSSLILLFSRGKRHLAPYKLPSRNKRELFARSIENSTVLLITARTEGNSTNFNIGMTTLSAIVRISTYWVKPQKEGERSV